MQLELVASEMSGIPSIALLPCKLHSIHNVFVLLPAAHRSLSKHPVKLGESSLHTAIININILFYLTCRTLSALKAK